MTTLIDFADTGAGRLRGAFGPPRQVLVAHAPGEVRAVLDAVQALSLQGFWCVGYVRYEAAPAFDASLAVHTADPAQGPLAWFGVFDALLPWPELVSATAEVRVDWQDGETQSAFDDKLARIHRAIAEGEVYQVNYTAPVRGHFQGEAQDLFMALLRAQPGGFAA